MAVDYSLQVRVYCCRLFQLDRAHCWSSWSTGVMLTEKRQRGHTSAQGFKKTMGYLLEKEKYYNTVKMLLFRVCISSLCFSFSNMYEMNDGQFLICNMMDDGQYYMFIIRLNYLWMRK